MATPTTRLKLKKQALSENLNTWGLSNGINGVIDQVDVLAGYLEVDLGTSTSYTFGTTNYSVAGNEHMYRAVKFTGTPASGVTVNIPAVDDFKFVENATGQTITFSNGSTTASLADTFTGYVRTDGSSSITVLVLPDGVNVQTVAANIASVNTVAGQISPTNNIATLASISSDITTTAGANANITTVAGQISPTNNLGTVANIASDVSGVNAIASDVTAVNTDPLKTNISTTAGAVTNINTVAGQISPTNNIATVASADANLTTVAGQISPTNNLGTVAGIASDISTTAGANANITSVAGQISPTNNIATVAGSTSQIATVAGQISPTNNVSTLAGISSDISGVAAITSDITAVNTNPFKQSIIDVDANSTNISNVGGSITSVNTVANNLTSVNSFGNTYQISTNNPTTGGDGSSALADGMLAWVQSADKLRVYNATSGAWEDAGSATNGTVDRHSYVATANQTTFPATGAISYNPNFVDVYLNGIKLVNGTDVTVSSGSNIVLASGAAVNDTVDVVAYGTFALADVYTKTQSDNRYVQPAGAVANVSGGAAQGILYQSAASTTAHLAAGTTGQFLQTNGSGSAPTWVNAPAGSSIASTLKFA